MTTAPTKAPAAERAGQYILPLMLCWLGMFSNGFAHKAPLSVLASIESSLGLSAAQISIWFNIHVFGMAILALPVGLAVDRYGPTLMSNLGMILVAIGGISWGFVSGFKSLWLSTAVLSIGGIIYSIAVPKVVTLWVASKHMGKGHGLYMSGNSLGSALGAGIIGMLSPGDWRAVLRYTGLALSLCALVWCLTIRKSPAEANPAGARHSSGPSRSLFLRLPRSRTLWILIGILFIMMSANVSWLTFGYSYLSKSGAGTYAGLIIMISIIGTALGAAVTPTLSDRIRLRRPFFLSSAVILSLMFLCLVTVESAPAAVLFATAALIGFAIGSIAPMLFVVAAESSELGPSVMGLAVGMMLLIGNAAGFLAPAVGGATLGTLKDAVVAQYHVIWKFLAGFVVIIGALAYLLKETGAGARELAADVRA